MSEGDIARRIELERTDAARKALEHAADRIESYSANELYRKALKIAARMVRSINPQIF
jgi:hypothetical protein